MKTIKFLLVIKIFLSFTFSITAQEIRVKPTEMVLDQEPAIPGKPISNIPACFCCGDKIYQLQQPTIKGEDLICKDRKNVFKTINCEGANINWSTAPSSISFTGQGTSSIQIDYNSIPAGTTTMVVIVQIKCGNKVVSNKIQVKVCPPCSDKQIIVTSGEDAIIHGLTGIYSVSGLNYKDSNFGSYQSNSVSTWTYNGTPGTVNSLIKFELPQDLVKECITKAQIVFKEHIAPGGGIHSGAYGTAVSQSTNFELRKVTSPWSANTVTWNTKPTTTSGIPVAAYSSGADDISIDITSILPSMLSNNQGFMLHWADNSLTSYYRSRWFGSFEAPVGKKPVLVIN